MLRKIYAWYCIVLASHYHIVQKHNNKERSKTMRNLTKPCINLSECWTSMKIASNVGKECVTKPLKRLLGGYTQDCILKGIWLRWSNF